ncbi:hypothetical protein [Conchiformibius steedae]|uniref:hypothetical protein n=1 Tax=Conchiformibius steedae TaxID=153493 RepID=UPI0026EF7CBF|nr:hypothetical protein [Conchiformibius steedae]
MKKWIGLLALLPFAAWADEPPANHDIARQMVTKKYKQKWVGQELGNIYYLDSKVAIDQHRFYILADGLSKTVSIVSCVPNARYIMTILAKSGKEIDEYSNPAVAFSGKDFQDFIASFKDNEDLPYLCQEK